MIKRNKIIIIITTVLISSAMAFVFFVQEGPVSGSEKEMNDTDLPLNNSHIKKTNEDDGYVLDNDSLYERLSNSQTKDDDKLKYYQDSI